MQEAATPETGPADAPASAESIAAELAAGTSEAPADDLEEITQELVNEAEGTGEAEEAPQTEEDATEPVEEPEESPEGQPEEQVFTVKVNGEEREVPLSDLLNGYSRTEDYKAKTMAVAEERRSLEAQKGSLEADLKADYANQLEEATNLFAQFDPVLMEARNINWDALKAQDPAAFVAAQDAVNERLTAIQQMRQHLEKVRGESQEAQRTRLDQERAQRFDATANEIVKAMPELADEAKFSEFANSNVELLRGDGFTNEEIVDALDHRVLRLADDARKWRAHEAALKALPEKKVVPKSAVKPLTSDATGSRASKPRFPANADRQRKGNWIAQQILESEE